MAGNMERLKELLTLAHRAKKTVLGWENVKDLTKRGYRGFVLLAEDISDRIKREAYFLTKKGYKIFLLKINKKNLASLLGKKGGNVGAIFLPNTKLTFKIEKLLLEDRTLGKKISRREVANLEVKRIHRTTRFRLQENKENFKGRVRSSRKGKYEINRGTKGSNRPDNNPTSSTPAGRGRKSRRGSRYNHRSGGGIRFIDVESGGKAKRRGRKGTYRGRKEEKRTGRVTGKIERSSSGKAET
jgi:ribosomal protein L7Ae-like RNA K-turn-binding protein